MATAAEQAPQLPSKGRANYALFMLFIVYAVSIMDRMILSVLQDDIKVEFGLSDTQLGLLTGFAFALFYTGLGIPIARLADRKSRVGILSLSLALWSIMTVLCGMATSFIALFLARMGVGVGEAGSGPPSQSLLADYFEKSELPKALAIYGTATSVGAMAGAIIGGLISETYGWRIAFFLVGSPGIILGLIVWLTVKEPVRGQFTDQKLKDQPSLPFFQTARSLLVRPIYLSSVLTHATGVVIGYAVITWLTPFYERTFGLETAEVTIYTVSVFLFGGLPGILAGGYLSRNLSKRDPSWQAKVPMIGALVCAPLYTIGFSGHLGLVGTTTVLVMAGFFAQWTFAPSLALIQGSTEPDRRALAASLLILTVNILGLGIGPLVVGSLSDFLALQHGVASLSRALMWFSGVALLGGVSTYWTLRSLQKD